MTSWWGQRPGVERFDLSTRAPLYLVSVQEPVVLFLVLNGQAWTDRWWVTDALLVVTVAHTICCVAVLRDALRRRIGGPPLRTSLVVAAAALTVAGLVVGPLALSDYGRLLGSEGFPVGLAVSVVFCAALTVAVTPVLTRAQLVAAVVVPALLAGSLQYFVAPAVQQTSWTLNYLLVVGTLAVTYRSSTWLLGLVWEIDRARDVQARLAVAEERLRVARDLHDVLGRNLTLIAVTSELAAGLVHRDLDDAATRMLQVRQLAQDSMRDVREVVGGRRTTDLDAELAGARSVLRSAGIDTRVTGDSTGLPAGVQSAFGWVVREASTNILRHAAPQRVSIDLDTIPSSAAGRRFARLRIENDGTRPAAPVSAADGHGHGLPGLGERLAGLGGQLIAEPAAGGRFRVEARMPLPPAAEPGS